jgi:hypothetical protein
LIKCGLKTVFYPDSILGTADRVTWQPLDITDTSVRADLIFNLHASFQVVTMLSRNEQISKKIILNAEAGGDASCWIWAVICDHWSNMTIV